MSKNLSMNPNQLVKFLGKPAEDFTRADIVRYCVENEIEFVNFHYCGWDGHLKTLNFVIQSQEHLENILASGERVDGSSLFPFVEAGKSDLYVVPRYKTAFRNPFEETPTLDVLCSFFNRDGEPFEGSPQYILHKAHKALTESTGLTMEAMGELEYYVIAEQEDIFPVADQKGYHESAPFNKFTSFRTEAMKLIAAAGGNIKYGHSEVGNFTQDGLEYEQNEIEFLPVNIEDAADQLVIAKWMMRQLAYEYGVKLTFAPKITAGKAGSGMHIHCKFSKNGKSMMTSKGELTDICKKAIAGYMVAGTSLPAFGNPHPLSFFRLVPHQEAPTSLCWSLSNRSALVRVPLGWTKKLDMAAACNPKEKVSEEDYSYKQTFEWRASDGFADTYLLMAALCCAARYGLESKDSLSVAEKTYVGLGVNIHDASHKELQESLEQLPASCVAAAGELDKDRAIYTAKGIFPDSIIDFYISYLRSFKDENLRKSLEGKKEETMKLVNESLDRG